MNVYIRKVAALLFLLSCRSDQMLVNNVAFLGVTRVISTVTAILRLLSLHLLEQLLPVMPLLLGCFQQRELYPLPLLMRYLHTDSMH